MGLSDELLKDPLQIVRDLERESQILSTNFNISNPRDDGIKYILKESSGLRKFFGVDYNLYIEFTHNTIQKLYGYSLEEAQAEEGIYYCGTLTLSYRPKVNGVSCRYTLGQKNAEFTLNLEDLMHNED